MEKQTNRFSQASQQYPDLFSMTREESIYFADKLKADSIWRSARLEGIPVTYADTETILEGVLPNKPKVGVVGVIAIVNLKHAWDFILDILDTPTSFQILSQVNSILGQSNLIMDAGRLRGFQVPIGGTSWIPEIPDYAEIQKAFSRIFSKGTVTEQAMRLMLFCMRTQPFSDGNKRSATLLANHHLLRHGAGLITIPVEVLPEFKTKLIEFYETENYDPMLEFLYSKCIRGIVRA